MEAECMGHRSPCSCRLDLAMGSRQQRHVTRSGTSPMSSEKIPALAVGVVALILVSCGGSKSSPVDPTPVPPGTVTLSAPAHAAPADDAQTNSLQPELTVANATSSQSGAKTYEFEVSAAADFAIVVIRTSDVSEDADGQTGWTVSSPLQPTTRYWWRVRVKQGSNTGPWSTPTRFRSRIEGFNRPGELFDPLTNGSTVGTLIQATLLPGQGVRLDSLGSRVTYTLPQNLPEGEFSLFATELNSDSAGDSTKLFSMQQGSTDMTTNPYRATIEKRDHGTVTFRFIAGDTDARADGVREDFAFNPSAIYFWKFTWGNGFARLTVLEGGENGRVVYNRGDSYSGTYRPNPHIAHLGAPPGRAGINTASVPGAVISNVWLSSKPRPSGLGSATLAN